MAETIPDTGINGAAGVPFFLRVALLFLLICLDALVAKFVVFSFTTGPGTSFLYIVAAVMIITTLWFGMYGAVAAYFGCWIGAGVLSGLSPGFALFWSIADLIQVLIPLIAFRMLGADVALTSRRDVAILLVSGILLNNLIGAVCGTLSLGAAGLISAPLLFSVFAGWFIGNVIVTAIIVPPVLYFLTPLVREQELFVTTFWK
jgi:hypothetical protein